MPVITCRKEGKPGYKWGVSGHCYTYTSGDEGSKKRARNKALQQGKAMHVNR